jgi:hypothetical protein
MSTALWEQYIFSKPYFDPRGLIVAVEGARPVGFVHAAFGPTAAGDRLDPARGVICRLFVGPHVDRGIIMTELLAAAEHYLESHQAREAVVGNSDPNGPFYLGLYGSSRLAGLLQSDAAQVEYFLNAGYQSVGQRVVLQRSLTGFRPPVDRDQVRHRKLHDIIRQDDPLAATWWESCATSHLERYSFNLVPKVGGPVVATAMAAHIPSLSMAWGARMAGFEDVAALSDAWHNGAALLLIAEAMKTMQSQGVALMEAVIDDPASPLGCVLTALGFREVDRGLMLRKSLSNPS